MTAQLKIDAGAVTPSLATIAEAVRATTGISAGLRRDIVQAIETVAQALGREPQFIAADPASLRQQVDKVPGGDVKLTPGRWRHLLALLDDGLVMSGLGKMPSRVQETLSPWWSVALKLVPNRYQRSHLRRLAVFCQARQVSPDGVDDKVLDAYRAHLEASLVDRPLQIHRDAVLAWNAAVSGIPGWPQVVLQEPRNRGETSLPFSDFPASFAADAEAYISHLSGEDLLSERADKQASPVTLRNCRTHIRRAASELVRSRRDPLTITGLSDLVAPEAAKLILQRLWARERQQPKGQTHNIGRTLLAIARHRVKAPEADIALIAKLCRNAKPPKTGMTDKNARSLTGLLDEATVRMLLRLPDKLLEQARLRPRSVSDAACVQAAVAVAILLVAPMREKNLAELKIDETLRLSDAPGGTSYIFIEAWRTKNKQRLQYVLPPATAELIRIYLDEFQPLLAGRSSPWLFPNQSSGHKRPGNLAQQVPTAIQAATGFHINLHRFRHFAAALFLKRHPGDYETVRQMLGHKSIKTTIEFYCGLEQQDAFKRYDAVLDVYRREESEEDV